MQEWPVLASILSENGQVGDAVLLTEQALKLQKIKVGDDHTDTTRSMYDLAILYSEAGEGLKAM